MSPGYGGLVFLDTGFEVTSPPAAQPARAADVPMVAEAPPPEGLELTQAVYEGAEAAGGLDGEPAAALEPLTGLEPTNDADFQLASFGPVPGLELDAGTEEVEFDGVALEAMDQADPGVAESEPVQGLLDVEEDLDLAVTEVDFLETGEPEPDLDLDFIEDEAVARAPTSGLPLIDATPGVISPPGDELAELEERILDDPESPDLHRELADRLLLLGDLARAAEELRLSLQGYERAEDWGGASGIADRLVALEPDAIVNHQKRVELAFRTGERAPLLDAYLALGDALGRAGATEKALAVYGRVQEHDPHNARASAAIGALTGPPPPAAAPPAAAASPPPPRAEGSFIDLGSMILEESGPRDTRMRIDRRDPQHEDEQREFQEILEQFKRGIDQNLETDDYQSHYDLGIAYKEMGLLDEAIAEFQKALRAPEGRLRTSEALGMAFFEKGQFAVSEAVLRRAVEAVDAGDEAKIGVIYWLGRALEAQGKHTDALTSYERAMAVDIRFLDLGERIHRLTAGPRE
jgi:tetratricopeptide (TPR) repeat protein